MEVVYNTTALVTHAKVRLLFKSISYAKVVPGKLYYVNRALNDKQ